MPVDVGSSLAVPQFALQLVEGDQTVHYIWSPRKQLRDNTRPSQTGADGRWREERVGGGEVGCWWWAGLDTTGTRQWPCGPASLVPAPSRPHIGDMGTPAQPLISRYVEE